MGKIFKFVGAATCVVAVGEILTGVGQAQMMKVIYQKNEPLAREIIRDLDEKDSYKNKFIVRLAKKLIEEKK